MKFPEWKYPQKGALEQKKEAVLLALKIVDDKSTTPRTLQLIAEEYSSEDQGMVWPVWQALAYNPRTPLWVLRGLAQKQLWYLQILLVQHKKMPNEYVHQMKNLPRDVRGTHASYKGYDRNRELRAIARKRLGLPLEDENEGN